MTFLPIMRVRVTRNQSIFHDKALIGPLRVRITRNKSIFHDEALIGPQFFIVIKDLLIGIITEGILFNIKLPVHDFIVVIFANSHLVIIIKRIRVDIPADGLGRPGLHHYGHGCT